MQRKSQRNRLLKLLETVTGTVAPDKNKFGTLIATVIKQRNGFERQFKTLQQENIALSEQLASVQAARRQLLATIDDACQSFERIVNTYELAYETVIEKLTAVTKTSSLSLTRVDRTTQLTALIDELVRQFNEATRVAAMFPARKRDES